MVGRSEGLSTTLVSLNASGKLLTADDIAADGSTYKRITANQQSGGNRAYSAIDSGNVAVSGAVDFSRDYTNKNIDNVPDGSTRMGPTVTRMNAATDTAGDILLKNIGVVNGSTSGPAVSGNNTYEVVTDLSITKTTQGNQVYLSFAVSFSITGGYLDYLVYFALFRDSTRVSPEYCIQASDDVQYCATGICIDSPSAASHAFTVKCKAPLGTTVTFVGIQRSLSMIELG